VAGCTLQRVCVRGCGDDGRPLAACGMACADALKHGPPQVARAEGQPSYAEFAVRFALMRFYTITGRTQQALEALEQLYPTMDACLPENHPSRIPVLVARAVRGMSRAAGSPDGADVDVDGALEQADRIHTLAYGQESSLSDRYFPDS